MYRVNEFITIKLIEDKTVIFVKGEDFRQCKHLLINIPVEKIIFKVYKFFDNLYILRVLIT